MAQNTLIFYGIVAVLTLLAVWLYSYIWKRSPRFAMVLLLFGLIGLALLAGNWDDWKNNTYLTPDGSLGNVSY